MESVRDKNRMAGEALGYWIPSVAEQLHHKLHEVLILSFFDLREGY